ncbi:DEAD/DEAH box helicase [Shewanella sp. MBTL60-007]|uniref:DEAD/DEAH box helicase n=1 Tax=Shewanella sp. MBTL60-007 TaxID=2815911 RepID=UPI001BBCAEB7|nr:AAA domain-containing protein [Shewanella sp. MBTL60-007]GIU20856.1 hypothetical protein TUM3792_20980 [Shewanella sp. MBTL60-007]
MVNLKSTLEFWLNIERFTASRLPKYESSLTTYKRYKSDDSIQLSAVSELDKPLALYCGLFDYKSFVYPILTEYFQLSPEFNESNLESSALYALANSKGQLDIESLTISECLCSISQAVQTQFGSYADIDHSSFSALEEELKRKVIEHFPSEKLDPEQFEVSPNWTKPLQVSDLNKIVIWSLKLLKIDSYSNNFDFNLITSSVSAITDTAPLNSFFARDLYRILESNDYHQSTLLNKLLAEPDTDSRININIDVNVFKEALTPNAFPLGRWPTKTEYSLSRNQQFAINNIHSALSMSAGVYSVNGPPGTGKSTILRDQIAAVVTNRAIKLSQLANASEGFVGKETFKSGDYTRTVNKLHKDLTGFELVIASSSNDAVANIIDEVPTAEAVEKELVTDFDYLNETASIIADKPCWGLIAAKLGNRKNTNNFFSRLLYSEASNNSDNLYHTLKQSKPDTNDWQNAVENFNAALLHEANIRDQLTQIENLAEYIKGAPQTLLHDKGQLSNLNSKLVETNLEIERLSTVNRTLKSELEQIQTRINTHTQLKPSIWDRANPFNSASNDWKATNQALISEFSALVSKEDNCKKALATISVNKAHTEAAITAVQNSLEAFSANLEAKKTKLVTLTAEHKVDSNHDPMLAPWDSKSWQEARTRLFLKALNLHKAFLFANGNKFAQNLLAISSIAASQCPLSLAPQTRLAAWQNLFMITPLVSTTLSSVERLFFKLPLESFGWSMIDESGQVSPAHVAGLTYRSKRLIPVGDPLQLETISILPTDFQSKLAERYGLKDNVVPAITSAQTLADGVNKFGTYVDVGERHLWLGSPLNIHRRCESPMFEIFNAISYNNTMLTAVSNRTSILPKSQWFSVESNNSSDHFIKAEADEAFRLIHHLRTQCNVANSDIFLISPFKAVASKITSMVKEKHLTGIKAGTVHITQGQQRKVVIFVLGGGTVGARAWAAEKPNLLNVAASRAEHRFYIIGDENKWGSLPFFTMASIKLRSHSKVETIAELETL